MVSGLRRTDCLHSSPSWEREKEEARILYTKIVSGYYIVFSDTRHVYYTRLDVSKFTYLPTLRQTVQKYA